MCLCFFFFSVMLIETTQGKTSGVVKKNELNKMTLFLIISRVLLSFKDQLNISHHKLSSIKSLLNPDLFNLQC